MNRLAIITNPLSERNRRHLDDFRATVASLSLDENHHQIGEISEIPAVLERCATDGVTTLVVNGGDGTIIAVLSALLNEGPFVELPAIAVLPAGMTNLISADVGASGLPDRALRHVIERLGDGAFERMERPVLSVRFDPERPPMHGMFLGGAGFRGLVRRTEQQIHGAGVRHTPAVVAAILGFLWRSLRGPRAIAEIAPPVPTVLEFEDGARHEAPLFLLLASTLQRLVLGVHPFWPRVGEPNASAPIGVTWIEHPPRWLWLNLPALLRGRPSRWMRGHGYHSRTCGTLRIWSEADCLLDGEEIPASPRRPIEVYCHHRMTFVR